MELLALLAVIILFAAFPSALTLALGCMLSSLKEGGEYPPEAVLLNFVSWAVLVSAIHIRSERRLRTMETTTKISMHSH